ncbi:DUF4235 domain-containing protein [Nocardioides sp. HM23]|uniref:DUF4235 domain-containing protein n=1 Tax=Nocardioides bizhenqiangii TaxID=3095076 RepID=UPI002AC9F72F|nr:DUF4235 domain-containing protein [Nocardioides sp. HM23]MDZ5620543.1 DUF4235 domain-containing protein [Nocardioides sp. HM23]
MAKGDGSKVWSIFSLAAALGAAAATRKGIDKSWQVSTGKKPPENPADPDIDLWEAVAWAAVTGAAVSLARMYAQRRAASYYVKSTGKLPPPLRRDGE